MIISSLINIYDKVLDFWADKKRNITTTAFIDVHKIQSSSPHLIEAKACQATHYRLLDFIFKKALEIPYAESNFIDVGCGLGRVVIYASDFPFKSITGVDIGENIIEMAKTNTKDRNINLICQDILNFSPPLGKNIYFLYNPFSTHILKAFVESEHRKDDDLFIYINPLRGFVFDMYGYAKMVLYNPQNHNRIIHLYSKSGNFCLPRKN